MQQEQPNNPLHGKTLEYILNFLVDRYGWKELGERIPVCGQQVLEWDVRTGRNAR